MVNSSLPKIGICALTGERGKYVKSHIIPRALTKPRENGLVFPQFGSGQRPVGRRDSWYDTTLVTQAGEDLLTKYDTWAITELRRLKLIWQSWGPMQELKTINITISAQECRVRKVIFSNSNKMRLFLLSLLWRAASTNLKEFDEVILRFSELRRIKNCLKYERVPPEDLFPITLAQLSTIGPMHNQAAIRQVKNGSRLVNGRLRDSEIIRLYFDGLIVHFHVKSNLHDVDGLYPMLVGCDRGTLISTVTFEISWQKSNLEISEKETELEFPGAITRIKKRR